MIYLDRLKELREYNGYSQREIAENIGIKRSTYNEYEQQYSTIPTIKLNEVANFYGISIDFLLGLTEAKNYDDSKKEIDTNISKQRLKTWRKENKITQKKLAEMFHSSQHVIVCYEKGSNFIGVPYLYTICSKYKISADYLLGKIDNPQELS